MISFLTPILGLYGINVKEFLNEWELKTKFIDYEITIPTRVFLSKIKTFEIILKTPSITNLLYNYSQFTNKSFDLNFLTLYKIVLLKSISNSFFYKQKLNIYYKMTRSYLKSINRNINSLLNYKKKKSNLSFLKNLSFNNNLYFNNLLFIKKSILFNNIILNNYKYGLIFYFPGYNNNSLNILKDIFYKFDLNLLKINNKIFKLIFNNKNIFYGSNIIAYNPYLANILYFFQNIYIENKFKFFLFYIKLNQNLCNILFFKKYITNFLYFKNNNLNILILKCLKYNYLNLLKINFNNNKLLLKLLFNKI